MSFPVTLSRPATTAVTVQYTVTGETATGGTKAAAGVDFRIKNGTLTFTPAASGQTVVEKAIGVTIAGDTTIEPDETFLVTLSDPTGATLGRAVWLQGVRAATLGAMAEEISAIPAMR